MYEMWDEISIFKFPPGNSFPNFLYSTIAYNIYVRYVGWLHKAIYNYIQRNHGLSRHTESFSQ